MNIFSYGMLRKLDISSKDNKATILIKVRELMVARSYPIKDLALFQKLLLKDSGYRALCIFDYMPEKYTKKKMGRRKKSNLLENVRYAGKEWEL